MRTSFVSVLLASAVCVPLLGLGSAAGQDSITVVSWGGAYTDAQRKAFYEPFTEATGIKINSLDYNGGLGEVRAQVEAGNVQWDVFVGEVALSKLGCAEGLLEELDHSQWPPAPDGTPPAEDFLPGTLPDCGVGSAIWSTVIAYDKNRLSEAPTSVADFFDLEKFPGKRGLRRAPEINLEWALLADGVPTDKVYEVLATEEGVQRAFAKLDTIKDQVIWWEAGAQPPQLLADGEVALTAAYSARIFSAINDEKQPFGILWDGQVWDIDVWMVPQGAPHRENAMKYLDFVSQSRQQANLTNWSSYGPVRRSAISLIGSHAVTDVPMKDYIPTAHLENAIQANSDFWATHRDELAQRFNAWLAN